ncbi:AMP-binding protein [Bacillus tianshenii]|nr:AMP-binding protein [Bacillus tianshenii]
MEQTRLAQWMKKLGYDNYEAFLEYSTRDTEHFWEQAEKELAIEWFQPYTNVLNTENGVKWPKWYENGQLNAAHECVEKWAQKEEMKDETAIIWESDDGEKRIFTFTELNEAVARTANGFKQHGLKKGDVATIYMPMIPETVISMLAIAKIGAISAPAFSGYGADALSVRMNAAEATFLITADGFKRRGKTVHMKEEADKAAEVTASLKHMVVVRRLGSDIPWTDERDIDYSKLANAEPLQHTEAMKSDDPVMLIYTSGTTGKPKGAVHTHAGFPIKSAFDAGIAMDVKQKDCLFWYTDMGWMMGPFLMFGGLVNGASILLFEGTPDYPNPDRIWKIVEDHRVTHLGISPTLIRSLMHLGEEWIEPYSLENLRVIGSTGEPWNVEPWEWLFDVVGKQRIPIFNYSGGTEISGGILGNVLLRPIEPISFNSPIPGMAADVFNDQGESVSNSVGELVITKPWVGMTNGFWKEPERYEKAYWDRWEDTWVHGDWVIKDDRGFWTITGRSDDILNVAGKRLGPAEMETVLVDHEEVVEAGTIGVPDDIKGESAVCFVVLRKSAQPSDQLAAELITLVGDRMGKALKPKAIHFVSDLPKTRNAKVMRRIMKAAFLGKDTGDLSALVNPEVLEEIRSLSPTTEKA